MDSFSETATLLLLGIVALYIFYPYIVKTYPDTHEVTLQNQASISQVRRSGQTAVYRSNIAPHGGQLMTGLSIRDGYKTKNGTINDIWKLAADAKFAEVGLDGDLKYIDYNSEILPSVLSLGKKLSELSDISKGVSIVMPNSVNSLISSFGCVLFNIESCLISDNMSALYLYEHLKAIDAHTLIINGDKLAGINLEGLNITTIIYFGAKPKVSPTIELISFESLDKSSAAKTDLPEIDETLTPMVSSYYVDGDVCISKFKHLNFVAATAAQAKFLPKSQSLSEKDIILVDASISEPSVLALVYTGIVVGATIVMHPGSDKRISLATIASTNATVLIENGFSLSPLLRYDFSIFQNIQLKMSLVSLSKGNLPKRTIIPEAKSVRLIYAFSEGSNNELFLPTNQVTRIRALFGAHVCYGLISPKSVGPICQNTIYDYRSLMKKIGDRNEVYNVVSFGPPLPCVEVMLKDDKEHGYLADNKMGEVVIRGPCTEDTGNWVSTGISGEWGSDGCVRAVSIFE